jgi:hypothetical protein
MDGRLGWPDESIGAWRISAQRAINSNSPAQRAGDLARTTSERSNGPTVRSGCYSNPDSCGNILETICRRVSSRRSDSPIHSIMFGVIITMPVRLRANGRSVGPLRNYAYRVPSPLGWAIGIDGPLGRNTHASLVTNHSRRCHSEHGESAPYLTQGEAPAESLGRCVLLLCGSAAASPSLLRQTYGSLCES